MKQLLKNISPLNNRTEMPTALFVVKKIFAFWVYLNYNAYGNIDGEHVIRG